MRREYRERYRQGLVLQQAFAALAWAIASA
jgi:hypothetical protein